MLDIEKRRENITTRRPCDSTRAHMIICSYNARFFRFSNYLHVMDVYVGVHRTVEHYNIQSIVLYYI